MSQDNFKPPASAEDFHLLGLKALDDEKYDLALEYLTSTLAIDPINGVAWNNHGNALSALNQNELAVESYLKAIAYQPSPPYLVFYNLASAYYKLGQ